MLALLGWVAPLWADGPRLLLTPQRLRRLKLDYQRQSDRWLNFERRVKTVTDGPERGMELALYAAVTGDEARSHEAVEWAQAHGDARQKLLVRDWTGGLADGGDLNVFTPKTGVQGSIGLLKEGGFEDAGRLYAVCEYLDVKRSVEHEDARSLAPEFFRLLPLEFLLSLKPGEVERPAWRQHVAALALVALDPNLQGSQFLQSWAMEDSQMVREGPGVLYELLWADPYLPAVSYRNYDPWIYDDNGRLFARSSWDADSCWVAIGAGGVRQANCPEGWQEKTAVFGRLSLEPLDGRCLEAPEKSTMDDALILWKLQPGTELRFEVAEAKKRWKNTADAAGMWRAPGGLIGKVCVSGRR